MDMHLFFLIIRLFLWVMGRIASLHMGKAVYIWPTPNLSMVGALWTGWTFFLLLISIWQYFIVGQCFKFSSFFVTSRVAVLSKHLLIRSHSLSMSQRPLDGVQVEQLHYILFTGSSYSKGPCSNNIIQYASRELICNRNHVHLGLQTNIFAKPAFEIP